MFRALLSRRASRTVGRDELLSRLCLGGATLILVATYVAQAWSREIPLTNAVHTIATTSEEEFRKLVIASVLPTCEPASVEFRLAPIVVGVQLTASGRIASVELLQGPNEHISKMVVEAVRSWQFRSPNAGTDDYFATFGKLTFYAESDGAMCTVLEPSKTQDFDQRHSGQVSR